MDKTHFIALHEKQANYVGVMEACQEVIDMLPYDPNPLCQIKHVHGRVSSEIWADNERIKQHKKNLSKVARAERTLENRNKALHLTLQIAFEHGWLTVHEYINKKFAHITSKPRTRIEEIKLLEGVRKELDAEIKHNANKIAEVKKELEE